MSFPFPIPPKTLILVIVYYTAGVLNVGLQFVNLFKNWTSVNEDSPSSSREWIALLVGCSSLFLSWFFLGYFNTRVVGLYFLLLFYALTAFVSVLFFKDKTSKIKAYSIVGIGVYPELLIHFDQFRDNILLMIGLIILVIGLSILTAMVWLLFGSAGLFGVISSKFKKNEDSDLGGLIKIGFFGVVGILAAVPMLVTILQASLLKVSFNLILWINLSFLLRDSLIFLGRKTTNLLISKTQQITGQGIALSLAGGGLTLGCLIPENKAYVYSSSIGFLGGVFLALTLFYLLTQMLSSKVATQENG